MHWWVGSWQEMGQTSDSVYTVIYVTRFPSRSIERIRRGESQGEKEILNQFPHRGSWPTNYHGDEQLQVFLRWYHQCCGDRLLDVYIYELGTLLLTTQLYLWSPWRSNKSVFFVVNFRVR